MLFKLIPLVKATPALLLMDLNHSKVKCNEVQCTLLWMLQSNVISFRLLWQYHIFVSLISWNDLKRSVNLFMSYHVNSSQRLVTFWRWKTSPYVDHAVMWDNYLYNFLCNCSMRIDYFFDGCVINLALVIYSIFHRSDVKSMLYRESVVCVAPIEWCYTKMELPISIRSLW